jgi:hypothetical protein
MSRFTSRTIDRPRTPEEIIEFWRTFDEPLTPPVRPAAAGGHQLDAVALGNVLAVTTILAIVMATVWLLRVVGGA